MSDSTGQVNILLVDDNEVDVLAFKRGLKKAKILNTVHIAKDGLEALEMLREDGPGRVLFPPYVIVLDLNMPRMNGIEFLKEIRADPILRRAVVFVLTTSNDQRDKFLAFENHVAGYILKSDAGDSFLRALDMLDRYWRIVELPVA